MREKKVSKKVKKEIDTATKEVKDKFMGDYKHLFHEEKMLELYAKEMCNFTQYIDEKVKERKDFLTIMSPLLKTYQWKTMKRYTRKPQLTSNPISFIVMIPCFMF